MTDLRRVFAPRKDVKIVCRTDNFAARKGGILLP